MLLSAEGMARTIEVTPADNLAQILVSANSGDTILLAEGTYAAQATTYSSSYLIFHIIKPVHIRARGRRDHTILQVDNTRDQVVIIHAAQFQDTSGQVFTTNPNGTSIEGVTLKGGQGGLLVRDYQNLVGGRLSDIVLNNLKIDLTSPSSGHGVELNAVDRAYITNIDILNAYANGIYIYNGANNVLARNTIRNTGTQHGIGIMGGNGNRLVENNIVGSAANGIILLQTFGNRIERNSISGFYVDGITLTDGASHNWLGYNQIASNGRAAGRTHGTGIWFNCSANGNVAIGNRASGSAENGMTIFAASNNLFLGNEAWGNGHGGVFIWDDRSFCFNANYPGEAPNYNFVHNNYLHFNYNNAMVIVRGGGNTDISYNFLSGLDHFAGSLASANTGGVQLQTSDTVNVIGNTISDVNNGEFLFADIRGAVLAHNRHFNTTYRYASSPTVAQWDLGPQMGGNYWANFPVSGNPSKGAPFTDFIVDSIGHRGGNNADNYPFGNEKLGRNYHITLTQPLAGQALAASGSRGVRWQSAGCVLVDVLLQGADGNAITLASNYPDTGYYTWNMAGLAAGTYSLSVTCKSSTGQQVGSSTASGLKVMSSDLALISHHAGETVEGGQIGRINWVKGAAVGAINVYLSVDGGRETLLASNVTNSTYTDVTWPTQASSMGRLRIATADGAYQDTSDGYFSIQSGNGVQVTSPANGDVWRVRDRVEIEWRSPVDSARIDIDVWNGSAWQSIVRNYPDIGHYTWAVLPFDTSGQVRVNYYTRAGTPFSSALSGVATIGTVRSDVCVAKLSDNLHMSIPYLNFAGTAYAVELDYIPGANGSLEFTPVNVVTTAVQPCQPATYDVTRGLVTVPTIAYKGVLYWCNLNLFGVTSNGSSSFTLTGSGSL